MAGRMKIHLLVRLSLGAVLCAPAVALGVACSSTTEPVPAPPKDSGAVDSSMPAADTGGPAVDSGSDAGTDGPAPGTFGATCTGPTDCDSMVCFVGGMRSFCSLRCEAGTDCPLPPTTGVCNNMGYCK